MDSIVFKLAFVQDLWNIINRAKHPHFESEIIDQVKNGLISAVRQATEAQNMAPIAPAPEVKEEEAKEENQEAEVKEESSDAAAV